MQFSIFYQILAALALVQVAVAAGCTSSSVWSKAELNIEYEY